MFRVIFSVITIVVLLSATNVFGSTIYVPKDFPTIQQAITASLDGDMILVDPGTYRSICYDGKKVTVKSNKGPSVTILDGHFSGAVVRFTNNEGQDSVLEGFTITNGSGELIGSDVYGGGVYCRGSSPIIRNNIIAGNSVEGCGAGIACCDKSSPTIVKNDIRDNFAGWGAGIYCRDYSSPLINSNNITGNVAAVWGGGIECIYYSDLLIINNIISGNSAEYGGGIYVYRIVLPTITNNTICNNSAVWYGGGIMCMGTSCDLTVTNTILWDNVAAKGKEVYLGSPPTYPSSLHISYSDVDGGKSSVHIDPQSTLAWGPGMIDADPIFVNSDAADFHLTWGSPCGNAAVETDPNLPSDDFEGDPRVAWGGVDMGADEFYTHLYHRGMVVPGGEVDIVLTGWPNMSTTVGRGSAVVEFPVSTCYGDLYLAAPIIKFYPGRIPANGVLVAPKTIPLSCIVGQEYPYQALAGALGWPNTELTNLMLLTVQAN